MDARVLLQHLLRAPYASRTMATSSLRPHARTFALLSQQLPLSHSRFLSVPRLLQPSFWTSMIPKPLRERSWSPKQRESNPATPYIILGLLVGSQAIQLLWLKQDRARDMRRAEAKIGLLREVIERVQRGENVDVEGALGTGDPEAEREWAEVLRDIEEEEVLFRSGKLRKAIGQGGAAAAEESKAQEEEQDKTSSAGAGQEGVVKVESIGGAKFY